MTPQKLCLLSSEIMPYAKMGGLADVVGALLPELRGLGHEVSAFMPLYSQVQRERARLRPVSRIQKISMGIGAARYVFSVWMGHYAGTDVPVYFIECAELFERPGLYTFEADEHRRFLLFTRAAIETCLRLGNVPDIFHCNDWHTAFLPLLLKTVYGSIAGLQRAASVLTIHNIAYQGILPAAAAADLGLGAFESRLDAADRAAGIINPLKTGIKFADAVTTVSPTYAREICNTPLGMGMQQTLRERSNGVVGILNGVDYRDWNPEQDRHLDAHFGASDLRGKSTNKERLLGIVGLAAEPRRPLISMVTRLAEQKGIDLLFDALPSLLDQRHFCFLILGAGEDRYTAFFTDLASRYPGRVAFRAGYDEALAHLIEAGSDMFLMPSRYEPCGLNQMYSLRYGTIPIVRRTGGLADSVQHFDPATGEGTGCVFNDYDAPAVLWAVSTALDWFANQDQWRRLMQNAMTKDFSWRQQALAYQQVYCELASELRTSTA